MSTRHVGPGYEVHTTTGQVMVVPQAAHDVFAERVRQVYTEHWTEAHDDKHSKGEMADAAACYAMHEAYRDHGLEIGGTINSEIWPWDRSWWKPTTRRRDLVKAAALLIAEIERLDRAEARARDKT